MSAYLDFAIELARGAGTILMKHYGQIQTVTYTRATDFKTIADDESDAYLRQRIRAQYPDHNIVSEELDALLQDSALTWVIDPLDGTFPFTRGSTDHFAVCVSLCEGKTPIVGVIYQPKTEKLFAAEQGRGATLNGQPLLPEALTDIHKAMLAHEYGKDKRELTLATHAKLMQTGMVSYSMCYACASAGLALTAEGRLNGFFSHNLEPWDMAAGVILNREVGNIVTTIDGREWQFGERSILVANPKLHAQLLEVILSK